MQIVGGASLYYEAKSDSYVPYAANEYSESKASYSPLLSGVSQPTADVATSEKSNPVDLKNCSKDSRNKSDGLSRDAKGVFGISKLRLGFYLKH